MIKNAPNHIEGPHLDLTQDQLAEYSAVLERAGFTPDIVRKTTNSAEAKKRQEFVRVLREADSRLNGQADRILDEVVQYNDAKLKKATYLESAVSKIPAVRLSKTLWKHKYTILAVTALLSAGVGIAWYTGAGAMGIAALQAAATTAKNWLAQKLTALGVGGAVKSAEEVVTKGLAVAKETLANAAQTTGTAATAAKEAIGGAAAPSIDAAKKLAEQAASAGANAVETGVGGATQTVVEKAAEVAVETAKTAGEHLTMPTPSEAEKILEEMARQAQ